MQNKGAIRAIAIIFSLIFIYQLTFTVVTKVTENNADKYAEKVKTALKADNINMDSLRNHYLDSVSKIKGSNWILRHFSYPNAKEKEINLGLDLRGGMNLTLEVSMKDIVNALAGSQASDPTFQKAMEKATELQKTSESDFVTLFGKAFEEVDPNAKLTSIFLYEFKDKKNSDGSPALTDDSPNSDVLKLLKAECDDAVERSRNILAKRIDRFGVSQPNIQRIGTSGQFLVELPGIKDPDRVRKLLKGTAQLEFWETYALETSEDGPIIYAYMKDVERYVSEQSNQAPAKQVEQPEQKEVSNDDVANTEINPEGNAVAEGDSTTLTQDSTAINQEATETAKEEEVSKEEEISNSPLYDKLIQYGVGKGACLGIAYPEDTAYINRIFAETVGFESRPANLKLAWTAKPEDKYHYEGEGSSRKKVIDFEGVLDLVALKASAQGDKPYVLSGEVIKDARQDFSQTMNQNEPEVNIEMNQEGAQAWRNITKNNINKQIAIVLDDFVYSYPNVNTEIPNGRSVITGNFTVEEAQDLANILKAGKLPAPITILGDQVVGPSLGRESVQKGMWSMVFAFILVLVYMVFFYNKSGLVADIALLVNVFFLFGVLACLGSTLTLPGIAGIVLTLGMAVDSNVIIFERIKEELKAGKGIKLAIADGYKNAYSAIIDGNVTTLITGIILIILGTGPVHSFAVTLCIGILTSLATSIFISRLIFERMLDKEREITFTTPWTRNFLQDKHYDFIGIRRTSFIICAIFLVISLGSLGVRRLNLGIDFTGGRNYVVKFDNPSIKVEDVREALAESKVVYDKQGIQNVLQMGDKDAESWSTPEVKTYGTDGQIKITTKYLIGNDNTAVDSIIQNILFDNLKGLYSHPEELTIEKFSSEDETMGILSTQKVGATIASEVTRKSIWAIIVALALMFVYIAIRFKKWQYGVASIMALAQDTIIVLGMYSLFYNVLPFTMEVDQSFIAAVLTVIGYSINATVVIFDRIRENVNLHPKSSWKTNMNNAVNSTLTRSFNTSGSTLIVLLAIFIFGGDTIRGFIFALLVGVLAGTFSSVFLSSPFSYILMKGHKKDKESDENTVTKKK